MFSARKRNSLMWLATTLVVGALLAPLPSSAGIATTPQVTASVPSSYYEKAGPHGVTVTQGGPDHTLFYPSDLGAGGAQHPVLIWGNGTGASVAEYEVQLRHIASWGFVIAAANTPQSGSGQEMLAGARFLIAEDKRAGSVTPWRPAGGSRTCGPGRAHQRRR